MSRKHSATRFSERRKDRQRHDTHFSFVVFTISQLYFLGPDNLKFEVVHMPGLNSDD